MDRIRLRPKAKLKNYIVYILLIGLAITIIWFEEFLPTHYSFIIIFCLMLALLLLLDIGLNKYEGETKLPQYADDKEEAEFGKMEQVLLLIGGLGFLLEISYIGNYLNTVSHNIIGLPKFYIIIILVPLFMLFALITLLSKIFPILNEETKRTIIYGSGSFLMLYGIGIYFLTFQLVNNPNFISNRYTITSTFNFSDYQSIKLIDFNDSRFFMPSGYELGELKKCDSTHVEVKRILNLFEYFYEFKCK